MTIDNPMLLHLPEGVAIAYHRLPGDSPGVIFLGGFMSDMTGTKAMALDAWCRQQGQAYIRFDYEGHGASSGRFEEGTIGRWLGNALAVLDQLSEGPQILVGSSMGGWIMLLLALARPERVAGLVGVACAADFIEPIWQGFDEQTRAQLQKEGIVYLPSEYDAEAPYPVTLNLIEEARQHQLLNKDKLAIQCPVRLLHGMRDPEVPWQTSAQVAEHLLSEDVRIVLVKDGEHRMSRASDLTLLTDLIGTVSVATRDKKS
ncbi:MAG: alpha/beta hydrolase [Candidatus Competibacteraceae bacterium]|jgi:pimeloyl-ACP methyl ester carboxylesterase|nr:alpha/beta hydrolase [Candidatus Competibacteraceae bacterium]